MKRICILLALLTALALTGCAAESGEGLNIVATVFPPYDFARSIAGGGANVTLLLPPGADSHSYEPTPQDMIALGNADIFIHTGGSGESWAQDMLHSLDEPPAVVITMLETADPLRVEEEHVHGPACEHDHEHEHDHGAHDHDTAEYDEHVWTSPRNAILIAEAIAAAMQQADPENAALYAANMAELRAGLDELDKEFAAAVAAGSRSTIVFGDRFPMRYFTEEYGLECHAAFPGCSQDTEASAADVAALIDLVREQGIPVVFMAELSNGRIAEAIAGQTGAKVLTLHSCHNLSREDMEAGLTYLDIMRGNLAALTEALN